MKNERKVRTEQKKIKTLDRTDPPLLLSVEETLTHLSLKEIRSRTECRISRPYGCGLSRWCLSQLIFQLEC
jgi:ribosomal protein L34E